MLNAVELADVSPVVAISKSYQGKHPFTPLKRLKTMSLADRF